MRNRPYQVLKCSRTAMLGMDTTGTSAVWVDARKPWRQVAYMIFGRRNPHGILKVPYPALWVGRAAHGGHAARTLSREGDAATVTRPRTDVPQWYQGAGMNGSDLEKNRDTSNTSVRMVTI